MNILKSYRDINETSSITWFKNECKELLTKTNKEITELLYKNVNEADYEDILFQFENSYLTANDEDTSETRHSLHSFVLILEQDKKINNKISEELIKKAKEEILNSGLIKSGIEIEVLPYLVPVDNFFDNRIIYPAREIKGLLNSLIGLYENNKEINIFKNKILFNKKDQNEVADYLLIFLASHPKNKDIKNTILTREENENNLIGIANLFRNEFIKKEFINEDSGFSLTFPSDLMTSVQNAISIEIREELKYFYEEIDMVLEDKSKFNVHLKSQEDSLCTISIKDDNETIVSMDFLLPKWMGYEFIDYILQDFEGFNEVEVEFS